MSYDFYANFTIGTLASYPAIPASSTDPAVSFTLPLSAATFIGFTAAPKAPAPSYTGPIPTSAQFLSAALANQAGQDPRGAGAAGQVRQCVKTALQSIDSPYTH